ncbi:MAG: DUF4145 domain-containing protein, partial [Stellaceae bacterium]
LATIGIRTVFDWASTLLGAGSEQTFSEKLKELSAANKIGGEEKEILSTLTDAGSASAHRGWTPTLCEIDVLIRGLENFLERAFALKHQIRQIKEHPSSHCNVIFVNAFPSPARDPRLRC